MRAEKEIDPEQKKRRSERAESFFWEQALQRMFEEKKAMLPPIARDLSSEDCYKRRCFPDYLCHIRVKEGQDRSNILPRYNECVKRVRKELDQLRDPDFPEECLHKHETLKSKGYTPLTCIHQETEDPRFQVSSPLYQDYLQRLKQAQDRELRLAQKIKERQEAEEHARQTRLRLAEAKKQRDAEILSFRRQRRGKQTGVPEVISIPEGGIPTPEERIPTHEAKEILKEKSITEAIPIAQERSIAEAIPIPEERSFPAELPSVSREIFVPPELRRKPWTPEEEPLLTRLAPKVTRLYPTPGHVNQNLSQVKNDYYRVLEDLLKKDPALKRDYSMFKRDLELIRENPFINLRLWRNRHQHQTRPCRSWNKTECNKHPDCNYSWWSGCQEKEQYPSQRRSVLSELQQECLKDPELNPACNLTRDENHPDILNQELEKVLHQQARSSTR